MQLQADEETKESIEVMSDQYIHEQGEFNYKQILLKMIEGKYKDALEILND